MQVCEDFYDKSQKAVNRLRITMVQDDVDTQQTIHDYRGSLVFMPNKPETRHNHYFRFYHWDIETD